jgi:hypothetical protein
LFCYIIFGFIEKNKIILIILIILILAAICGSAQPAAAWNGGARAVAAFGAGRFVMGVQPARQEKKSRLSMRDSLF